MRTSSPAPSQGDHSLRETSKGKAEAGLCMEDKGEEAMRFK